MSRKKEIEQVALELYPIIYSSSRERDAYIRGAEWADEHPRKGLVDIDKVCNYLTPRLEADLGYYAAGDFIEDFCKAMEE